MVGRVRLFSVSAGIPDFRSPGGLFEAIAETFAEGEHPARGSHISTLDPMWPSLSPRFTLARHALALSPTDFPYLMKEPERLLSRSFKREHPKYYEVGLGLCTFSSFSPRT